MLHLRIHLVLRLRRWIKAKYLKTKYRMHLTSKQRRREKREERRKAYIARSRKEESVIYENNIVKCNCWIIFSFTAKKITC